MQNNPKNAVASELAEYYFNNGKEKYNASYLMEVYEMEKIPIGLCFVCTAILATCEPQCCNGSSHLTR